MLKSRPSAGPHSLHVHCNLCPAGLRSLGLNHINLRELPPTLLGATRLQSLNLQHNPDMRLTTAEVQQLLQALPKLQLLKLRHTGITPAAATALRAAAKARGLTVLLCAKPRVAPA